MEPIACFLEDLQANRTDELPILFRSQIILLMGKKSPRILTNIQGFVVPMLLDFGAELSVLSKNAHGQVSHPTSLRFNT